jgi:4-diphosphocytidyl-2-C-methyl-D-erythritol kinase
MSDLTVEAPGKINLHLRVKERRPDGFHGLESIFLALDFGDSLHFTLLDEPGAAQIRGFETPRPEENTVFRALALFRAETGFDRGLRVDLEKRIPAGGGMGGGSSDAASTLLALNTLSGAGTSAPPVSAPRLVELAGRLGSDVPFFLVRGAAWVSGRGELIQPLPRPPAFPVLLVNPGFPSETAGAFRLLDAARAGNSAPAGEPAPHPAPDPAAGCGSAGEPAPEALVAALAGPPGDWPFVNDFLPVLDAAAGGAYRALLSRIRGLGADFCGLSGAGSTCFGVFTDEKQAKRAAKTLSGEYLFVQLVFPLAR